MEKYYFRFLVYTGITFIHETYEEALETATEHDKPIYLSIFSRDNRYQEVYDEVIISDPSEIAEAKEDLIRSFKKWADKKYIIQDWAGNRLFPNDIFDTFEEGWDFIRENVEEDSPEDGTFDDYYVVELEDF